MFKTELSHTLAPSAHAVSASVKTMQSQLAAAPEVSHINVFFSNVLFPALYSYMNKPLCALFTCINLRNKKDETGDNINPSFCVDFWLWMQKDFKFFKHLSEIAEHY